MISTKAATIKRFEYSLLRSELKKQTSTAENNTKNQTRFVDMKMEKWRLEKDSSSLVYKNCNFNKFNIGDEEFGQLSE